MRRRTVRFFISLFIRLLLTAMIIFAVMIWGKSIWPFNRDVTGEIIVQSAVLRQKLESSKRLEVTSIDEEGTLEAKTTVIILGEVGSTTIRYRYTASVGIDLGKVSMTTDTDRIIFSLPEPEILNDGIEALEIRKHDFFSKAIDKSVESLLSEQRIRCRDQYIKDQNQNDRIWADTEKAFSETICAWLESFGERHYQFEFVRWDKQYTD